ncbi:BamA/OMP85 family outer membrane protein [Flavobacterium taihuense]|uniref:BamA/TamA family outer membrane protein n=1 Tax=Flavobacterium taihuense TaxID=2857508 RepID=A0ABS6XSK6_9FLAO|nr:POTRA domain-containing protein [Flavobacterium taihuense]MBW4359604.1 BamA/TamA family outer membrane protein [Flavobacterium taihuense]
MRLSLVIKKENVDLEKQVNKLNNFLVLHKSIKLVLTFIILGTFTQIKAQDRVPFDQGKKYILADVKVVGDISFNPQTVVTFAGLEKGQEITVPGEQISSSIKKLGKLGLFDEISFYVNRIENDSIYLDLNIKELPKINQVKFVGVSKSKTESFIKDNGLTNGKIVTENLITTTKNYIEKKYKKDGFFNAKVYITTTKDTLTTNQVNMLVKVDIGDKVKIYKIDFEGNKDVSSSKLLSSMKNTKVKNSINFLKRSKYIEDKYQEDLEKIVNDYKKIGYRDARILGDSVAYNKEKDAIYIKIKVEEGLKYYFGNIKFIGNTVYSDDGLRSMLGIRTGDVYNGVLLQERIADKSKPDGEDMTNLYQNNGYLFSNINAVETKTVDNTIDFEIRITEGPIAYFNKITVVGNDKTNDEVIYRELRTKPGEKYNKGELVRTIREIGQLGFFDPEKIDPQFKNVDSGAGTVDIEYHVVEKGASQIELQGGYGGGGFVGTLGLSFNNFSARNLFNKDAYHPLPMGDGQKVALRLQASSYYKTYSLSFSEPWFGGKRPIQFSSSFAFSQQYSSNYQTQRVDKSKYINITSLSVGMAKRLTVPDDFFTLSQSISYQQYDLHNYLYGLFTFANGQSKNLSYTIGLTRNSKGFNPIFPTYGAEFGVTGEFTLPYSAFNGVDYATLGEQQKYKYIYAGTSYVDNNDRVVNAGDYLDKLPSSGGTVPNKVDNYQDAVADPSKVDQEKYKWLEYYKVQFTGDWFTSLYKKLVLRTLVQFGFLGAYNQDRGIIPFERYYLGGDGMAGSSIDGRQNIQLRGYENGALTPASTSGDAYGATIYNKFSLELRYPITLKASASIYALTFAEAGQSYESLSDYQPFNLARSAGVGLRVFMPAFGLLGIDFGYGFDAVPGAIQPSGWQTHFIIGQQF